MHLTADQIIKLVEEMQARLDNLATREWLDSHTRFMYDSQVMALGALLNRIEQANENERIAKALTA